MNNVTGWIIEKCVLVFWGAFWKHVSLHGEFSEWLSSAPARSWGAHTCVIWRAAHLYFIPVTFKCVSWGHFCSSMQTEGQLCSVLPSLFSDCMKIISVKVLICLFLTLRPWLHLSMGGWGGSCWPTSELSAEVKAPSLDTNINMDK